MAARLVVHEGQDVYRRWAEPWAELLQRVGHATFFLRPDWLATWARHFGQDHRLFLLVAERDGQWIGGLPMALGSGKLGRIERVQKLECAGQPWFDLMSVPAANQEDCRETLHLILEWASQLPGWSVLAFHELPTESWTLQTLRELSARHRLTLHTQLASAAPMVDLRTSGWVRADYQRQLRRFRKRLIEQGGPFECEFRYVKPAELGQLLQECKSVELRSWKGAENTGVFRDGAPWQFFRELLHRLASRGEVAMATMRQQGRLLTYHWGYRHDGRFLSYNKAQLPEYDSVRIGHLLLNYMVEQGRELGFEWIDTSRGKLKPLDITVRYHGPIRFHGDAYIYASKPWGYLLRVARHGFMPILRGVMNRPGPPKIPESSVQEVTNQGASRPASREPQGVLPG